MKDKRLFRISFNKGVEVAGSRRLSNYGKIPYDSLVEELSKHQISDVKNVFHDDRNPSNQKQFTGLEMLKLWKDVKNLN